MFVDPRDDASIQHSLRGCNKTCQHPNQWYYTDPNLVTNSDKQVFFSFECKVLLSILGAKREDGKWRYDMELEREYGEPNMVFDVKISYVARVEPTESQQHFHNGRSVSRGVG